LDNRLQSPHVTRTFLVLLALAATAGAQSKLQLRDHTGSGVNGYDMNSTMISGEKDMLVIDPQFSLSEAHRLAAEILESKKNLATAYVTHPHPDHRSAEGGVPIRPNCRASRNGQCSKDCLARAAEVLVPHVRQ
jgi:hypothetical protein